MIRPMPLRFLCVGTVLLLGMGSGWLAGSGYGNPWFDALAKPWFMPPGWVFPVAWGALYALMGVAVADVVAARTPGRGAAVALFAVQLALNLAWSPLFFAHHAIAGGLMLIGALDLVVLATIAAFTRVRPRAALMLLPYVAWLGLATALNLAILRLNGGG